MKTRLIALASLVVVGGSLVLLSGNSPVAQETGLTLYGNVDVREVNMAFRQSGRLQSVLVEEGDSVVSGDIIAGLDNDLLTEQRNRAATEVQRAQAQLDKLENGSRPQEIARAEAEINRIEATINRLQLDLERQNELLEPGASSAKHVELLQSSLAEAEALRDAAQQSLDLLEEGPRQEDIDAAAAQLAQAQSNLTLAEIALADASLTAPAEGIITSRVLEPGAVVSSRDTVAVLTLTDRYYVRAYVEETALGLVAPGTRVSIRSDSSSTSYPGTVGFVSPRAEFTPRSVETEALRSDLVYRLRIEVDGDAAGLLQGMPVTVAVGS
ncbi:MAG: HlyD family efflux transporter periplasmic adaptor subunit [Pseudomonadales bacterium]|nr:HlyD family efflux transporter periplasmic adaptor subunit [Pseudomonadales bacterium]